MIQLLPQFTLPYKADEKYKLGQLHGASLSLAIISIAEQHTGPTLVITPDNLTANRLQRELHFFRRKEIPIYLFPDWEILPYDHFSPHQDIISDRLAALYQLSQSQYNVIIVAISTLMNFIPPPEYVNSHSFLLKQGDALNLEALRQRLQACGYLCVGQVMEHGEFAVRGSIIDLYPMGSKLPFRIELFDEEVDTIRTFDPDSQRSLDQIQEIKLLPAREFPLTETAIRRFRQRFREVFSASPKDCPIYNNISQGESAAGIEYYLPLFFEKLATLFDYLPQRSLIIRCAKLQEKANEFYSEVNERYEQLRHDITRPLLSPNNVCLKPDDLFHHIKQFPQLWLQQLKIQEKVWQKNLNIESLPELTIDHQSSASLNKMQKFMDVFSGHILICAESTGRREVLLELFEKAGFKLAVFDHLNEFLNSNKKLGIIIAPLEEGCVLKNANLAIITETELLGQQVKQQRLQKQQHQVDNDAIIRNLAELNVGAPVVHIEHGVGRYCGLTKLTSGDIETEYLTLEYAGKDKLYVPVASLHLISRYSGANLENAPLNHLGTKQWKKTKRKAQEKIRDVAAELLDAYARRDAMSGFAFKKSTLDYEHFAKQFPFEETPDQQQAIAQVINDMQKPKPMDRLICGDVGFGKTEVAMRAAFLAVQSEKQVAVLVPTTLLAEQHFHNFQDRFADWPVKIGILSRFHAGKEQTNTLQQLKAGKINVIIGTHKLLQSNIEFKNLGLLIIDEEHRFGVGHKEKIKSLRTNVDILTLTATPIPRTLNMSLNGIRDLSIIATAPIRRLSIKTFVSERNNSLIREAIMREILRGGQVYFLHNDISTIEAVAKDLKALVPESKIQIAHGQMRERQLENIMTNFYHQRFNVLVCTTIIESGIDIPSANTMLINRADKFGLAQLHQLRGRVGRSHHQAYAYLITPPKKAITKDAKKRLEAIASLNALGAGFTLATHDLEIRGAGELLGEEQSGHIQAIGFSLYMELLERTVEALKAGKTINLEQPLSQSVEVNLHISALIPENYIPDVHTRLTLYKRIANAKNNNELRDLQIEMIDRFGLLPEPVKNLFQTTKLKLQSEKYDVKKIDAGPKVGYIEFKPKPDINVTALLKMIQNKPKQYKLEGSEKLKFHLSEPTLDSKLKTISALFDVLSK